MKYIIYKITNLLNNKIYIGAHQCKDLNNNYLGSGKYLRKSIKKHGKHNFKKEILFCFKTKKEMYLKEKELVNETFIKRKDTYNRKLGGYGGWDHLTPIHKAKAYLRTREWRINNAEIYQKMCNEAGIRIAEWLKHHPEAMKRGVEAARSSESISKRKQTFKEIEHAQGAKNSQYGTCWITNRIENKKIKKEELNNWLKLGYFKGRIMGI